MPDPTTELKPTDAVPPVVEKTTTETTKATGAAAVLQPPPPPIIADDNARKWLAGFVIFQFMAVIGYYIYAGSKLDNTQMILGAEITFMTSVLNYYFGSSSGSTAKSAVIDKKP
jgi:hypothetical protein